VAQAVTPNVELPVTLATTVTQLTCASGTMRKLVIYESDVDVYVVTLSGTADGGALPSTGRPKFAASALPIEYDVSPFGFVGLAGVSAGTCRIEVR
jgi:hypothetical protein